MLAVTLLLVALAGTPSFSADFDGDKDIDMVDFGILQRNYGPAMPFNRFDLDRDGVVGPKDADLLGSLMTGAMK